MESRFGSNSMMEFVRKIPPNWAGLLYARKPRWISMARWISIKCKSLRQCGSLCHCRHFYLVTIVDKMSISLLSFFSLTFSFSFFSAPTCSFSIEPSSMKGLKSKVIRSSLELTSSPFVPIQLLKTASAHNGLLFKKLSRGVFPSRFLVVAQLLFEF